MVGTIKSRKIVDPKLHDFTNPLKQASAVEKGKLQNVLLNTSNLLSNPNYLKESIKNPSSSCTKFTKVGSRVAFKEPVVSYHEEKDPLSTSTKNIFAGSLKNVLPTAIKTENITSPKDHPAVTRFLNSTLDVVDPFPIPSKQPLNMSGITKTVFNNTDEKFRISQHQFQHGISKEGLVENRHTPSSHIYNSLHHHHGAEILKQHCKEQNPEVLVKLKETIQKQKENRKYSCWSPNVTTLPQQSNLNYNHDEKLLPIPHFSTTATPIRKTAIGPPAPNYKGFNEAKMRLQTPDGKIWKEDNFLHQSDGYNFHSVTNHQIGSTFKKSTHSSSKITKNYPLHTSSNSSKFYTKKKAVRKTGKIQLNDPTHKKALITPSSWREGHKVAEAILDSLKKCDSDEKNPESKKESPLKSKQTESEKPIFNSSGTQKSADPSSYGVLSAQAKSVLEDLNLSPSGEAGKKVDTAVEGTAKVTTKRPQRKKPAQIAKQEHPAIPKSRHYDPAQVQQYIARQKADRKRKQAERRRMEKEANEKRMRLLNDLDKRQKQARKKANSIDVLKDGNNLSRDKVLKDTFIKPDTDDVFPFKFSGYEGRLASFMQKLEHITNLDCGDEHIAKSKHHESPSKFLQKLGECMQETQNPSQHSKHQTDPSVAVATTPKQKHPTSPENMLNSHLQGHQSITSASFNQSLSKQDRIAALRAKSESLQERIELESRRFFDALPTSKPDHYEANYDRPLGSVEMDLMLSKEIKSPVVQAIIQSAPSSADSSFPSFYHEPSIREKQTLTSGKMNSSLRSLRDDTWQAAEATEIDHLDSARSYPGASRHSSNNDSFSVADMMNRINRKEYCAPSKPKWKEALHENHKKFSTGVSHGSRFTSFLDKQQNPLEVSPSSSNVPPWKRSNGDKYSVMNVFTRKFMKNYPSSTVPTPTKHTDKVSPRKGTPTEEVLPKEPHRALTSKFPTETPMTSIPASSNQADALIQWSEGLNRDDRGGESMYESDDTYTSAAEPKFSLLPPPSQTSLRYSPAVLEQKLNLELNRYDTIGDQINQLTSSETTQGVAMAQQETASIAQILQSRQMQHELEMERLAVKAKEKALEASQKLHAFQMDAAAKEVSEKEKATEEKRKMVADMQDEAKKNLKLQTDLAQASIKALSHHTSPHPRKQESTKQVDTTFYSSLPGSKATQKVSSSSFSTYTSSSLNRSQHSDDSSPTMMSEHSTTSVRPPENRGIRQELASSDKQSSSSSIKEELDAIGVEHTDTSVSESMSESSKMQTYDKSTTPKTVRKNRASRHEAVDSVHFDESMTEDERIELSRKAVMPSESHRRQKYKKSPRLTAASFPPDQSDFSLSSDDASLYHSKNYLSGLDESIKSSASLFGDADSSIFNRFMDEHVHKYMMEEEVRVRHQAAMLKLREKALKEKTKAELAWLALQKQHIRNKGEDDRMPPPLAKKKRAIIRRWQVETEEIKRLKAANKAASHDRELRLQQKKDMSRKMQTTQQSNEKLKLQEDGKLTDVKPVTAHIGESEVLTESDASTSAVDMLKKFKKSMSGLDGRQLTNREKALLRRRKEAEKLLEWKRKLDEEEKRVYDMEQQALQVWNIKDKSSSSDKATIQKDNNNDVVSPSSTDSTSILEDIRPHEASIESSSLIKDAKESNKIQEESSEDTIEAEYSQTFESGDITSSKLVSSKERKTSQGISGDMSTSTTSKPDEARVPLLKNKPSGGSLKARDTFESLSDDSILTQSETEQSDVECRVHALKEELKRRRLIADRLKKQQKKKHKEQLRAQEASLKSQIEAYDAFIKTTQQELNLELDSPGSNLTSVVVHSTKPQIRSPRKSEHSRNITRIRNSVPSLSSPDASPRAGSQKSSVTSIVPRPQSDSESSGRSSRSLSFDDEQHSADDITSALLKSPHEKYSPDSVSQVDRPKKLDIPMSKSLPTSVKSPPSLIEISFSEKDKSKTAITDVPLDKDVSVATEDEVSEQMSEESTSDRSGDSIPMFQISKSPVDEDDDKTPVASPMTTPTPDHPENLHVSEASVDVADSGSLIETQHRPTSLPDDVSMLSFEETATQQCEKILSQLLAESIDSTLALHRSIKHQQSNVPRSRPSSAPKLTPSAQNVLHLLSGDQVENRSKRLSENVLSNLLNDTQEKIFHEQEAVNEVEKIVRDADGEVEPTITRPVSPVFGASKDTDDWFDEDDLTKPLPELFDSLQGQLSPRDDPSTLRIEPVEIEYKVPHKYEVIVEISDKMIEFLYNKYTLGQLFEDDVASFDQFDSEVESRLNQNEVVESRFLQSIFDLVRQLLRELYGSKEEKPVAPWCKKKRRRRSSFYRTIPTMKEDIIKLIRDEVVKLFGFGRIEKKPETRISLKWGALKKKDNVDLLLIEELKEEEADWTDYDVDEAAVKSQLTETVFDLLLTDAITCLNRIEQSRSST